MELKTARLAIVRVGAGRGFVVEGRSGPLIVTAAHCLPDLPPPMSFSMLEERTFQNLLGALEVPPTIASECLFVDPIADIAVLGEPDHQELPELWEAFDNLVTASTVLSVSASAQDSALMLYLDDVWRPCALHSFRRGFRIDAAPTIQAGMSGSPILNTTGEAIGVVVTNEGPHPKLADHLPAWLARDVFD